MPIEVDGGKIRAMIKKAVRETLHFQGSSRHAPILLDSSEDSSESEYDKMEMDELEKSPLKLVKGIKYR